MKYTVRLYCGHDDVVDLGGRGAARERKIKWLELNGYCDECYAKKADAEAEKKGLIKQEMPYSEYKTWYANRTMVKDSYNPTTKTVVVYIPESEVSLGEEMERKRKENHERLVEAERNSFIQQEMPYSEYKNRHADCKTVKDSYNATKKTIVVYLPIEEGNEETKKEKGDA